MTERQIGDISLMNYMALGNRLFNFVNWAKDRNETVTIVVRHNMPEVFIKLLRGTGATQVIRAAFEGTATLHTEWIVLVEPERFNKDTLPELRHIQMAAKDGQVYPEIWEF